MLAALLAFKCFFRDERSIHVLLKMDNTSAIAYINKRGGTVSPTLNRLNKEFWLWCMERDITVQAQHLAGALNCTADAESRIMRDRSDWMLCPNVFQAINHKLGPLEVDLFASRLTTQLSSFVSWRPDPEAIATDAFTVTWTGLKAYANPPWSLVGRVLSQARQQGADLILVTPVWKTQPWYPTVLEMCKDFPLLIPQGRNLIQPTHPQSMPDVVPGRYKKQQLSEKATELMLALWREKSSKAYDSQFQKWIGWCSERSADPISCPIGEVVNFLADLFSQGYQYRSLNAYRSAISSVHDKVDGYDVGQHPLVSRLLKGAFHQQPPQPRYTQTWDVRVVTSCIRSIGANNSLSLQNLSHKLAMLMALTRPSRSADLANLDLNHRTYSAEGVTFSPTTLSKQSQQKKHGTEFFFPKYLLDGLLCPVLALKEYEFCTKQMRGSHSSLFLGVTKPHKPVCSSTIARWLKTLLGKAGIDTEIFKAHSV